MTLIIITIIIIIIILIIITYQLCARYLRKKHVLGSRVLQLFMVYAIIIIISYISIGGHSPRQA